MYKELFDVLEEHCDTQNDIKWLLRLQRKSSREVVTSIYSTSTSDVVRYPSKNVLPNMFLALDYNCFTFDEVFDWLGKSDEVKNLWIFVEDCIY